jgi:hypothetical protein
MLKPIALIFAPPLCFRPLASEAETAVVGGLPARDQTLAHELGHLILGHEGNSVVDAARAGTELVSEDLIHYMLNQRTRTGQMPRAVNRRGPNRSF